MVLIYIVVTGSSYFYNEKTVVGLHRFAVLIMLSNLTNWYRYQGSMQNKGMLSTASSAAHSLSLPVLIITSKCRKAWDRDVIDEDINEKLCLWHWQEANAFTEL